MKHQLKSIPLIIALGWGVFACGSSNTNTERIGGEVIAEPVTPSLTLLWETPAELITNESVHFEPSNGNIYVTNIEGGPAEKDGVGSISIISKDGQIVEREWVKGLHAPKGMTVLDGKLYVTDVDALVEIDLATGEILKKYEVENAQFLNDADTDGSRVYFTDMRANKILYLENGVIGTFAEDQPNINGLRIGPDKVLYGLDAEGFKKYDSDATFEVINDVVTGGDGLIILDGSTFLVSRWKGEIYLIQDGKETLLLDTSAAESNTADIGFIPGENIVLVPTFFKDKVAAYRLAY
ncbi:ATP-binding protein [Lunatimonas salinarum]|uniref:ATP-binding protein n=1 Tax=Lunatimonas salinarum TaxID=1774590 RepID=UPI001ADFC1A0|nr:ATP-binding protein [Lunatimonas salinarum]